MSKKRIALHLISKENDIKFRGPLSYRHMRIIGWITMVCAQIAIILAAAGKYWANSSNPHNFAALSVSESVFSMIGSLAVPLFLLANFALILSSRNDIKRLVILHTGFAIGFYLIFLLIYERYLVGIFTKFFEDMGRPLLDTTLRVFMSKFLSLNVFVDLLMCSLTYFFATYKPQKIFTGKRIYIFRALIILPIAYEVTCLLLKGFSMAEELFLIPMEVLPLLTTKPPLTFFAFVIVILFMKFRETIFLKRTNGDEEKYEEFLQTNRNSLHFSVFISIIFTIVVVIDIILFFIFFIGNIFDYIDYYGGDAATAIDVLYNNLSYWGIGKTIPLILSIPFIMLFSYTRKYAKKTKMLDTIIPLAGVLLILITYIEGFYEVIVLK